MRVRCQCVFFYHSVAEITAWTSLLTAVCAIHPGIDRKNESAILVEPDKSAVVVVILGSLNVITFSCEYAWTVCIPGVATAWTTNRRAFYLLYNIPGKAECLQSKRNIPPTSPESIKFFKGFTRVPLFRNQFIVIKIDFNSIEHMCWMNIGNADGCWSTLQQPSRVFLWRSAWYDDHHRGSIVAGRRIGRRRLTIRSLRPRRWTMSP